MASLQASFHAWADEGVPVAEMTGRLSEAISRRTGPDRFITFFLLILEPSTGEIEYTNAGHNPGLLLRADGSIEELGSHGLPLALFPGKPYGSSKLTLGPGDLLCLYTDGVTEANNPAGDEFGMPRLKEFLAAQVGTYADRRRGRPRPRPRGARAGRALRGRPDAGDGEAAACNGTAERRPRASSCCAESNTPQAAGALRWGQVFVFRSSGSRVA